MAEQMAMLIDSDGNPVGVEGNPLYVGGMTSVGSFVNLTDVEITNPVTQEYIGYDPAIEKFINIPLTITESLVDLADVVIEDPIAGDYLGYDPVTEKYINKPVTGTGTGDVTGPSGATAGNFPILDSTGKILSDSGVNVASIASGTSDHKVLADDSDSNAGYLDAKLLGGTAITISLLNFGGFHNLVVDADVATAGEAGIVKPGWNVNILEDGTIWVATPSSDVNADWNASVGVASILNKPTIPAAQVNSDWDATEGIAEILNKPSIPSEYTLPTATGSVLGGVKIGANVTITDGVISVASGGSTSGGSGSHIIENVIPAVVSADTVFTHYVCVASGTIVVASMSLESAPSASTTYCKVQVMKNGLLETDSVFTSDVAMQVTEATAAVNGVYPAGGTLDAARVAVVAGDVIWTRVNQADAGSAGLRVQVKINWT